MSLIGPAFGGSPLDPNGNVQVVLQDQATPPIDLYFVQANGPPTVSTVETALNDTSITVASTATILPGDYLGVFSGNPATARFFFAEVLSVVGSVVNLDMPFDFAYEVGSFVQSLNRDMDTDGSTTPEIFDVRASSATNILTVDITRIMVSMVCASLVDLSTFGDLTALTEGIVLRKVDGDYRNIWNVKTNNDFSNLAFDLKIYEKTNPAQGIDGLSCRYSFAGQEKHGVALRLEPGEKLEIINPENLTGLTSFRVIAQGHVARQ